MNILAIDTSCDETSVSVLTNTSIKSNEISSQVKIHKAWGGVVPTLAKRAHQQNFDTVLKKALTKANVSLKDIDFIAVTKGPGLAIALEVGIAKVIQLSKDLHKPLLAVNHLEGHILSFLGNKAWEDKDLEPLFPAVGVVLSGGHTLILYIPNIGEYHLIGQTLDDAMGEAYDKVGRMLSLGYPAGPIVEEMATKGILNKYTLPVPLHASKTADLSFSGLKTAASRLIDSCIKAQDILSQQDIADISLAFENAAITHLTEKMRIALRLKEVRSIIIGGGVCANKNVRKKLRALAKEHNLQFFFPKKRNLCVDNAAMIAIAAYFKEKRGEVLASGTVIEREPNFPLSLL